MSIFKGRKDGEPAENEHIGAHVKGAMPSADETVAFAAVNATGTASMLEEAQPKRSHKKAIIISVCSVVGAIAAVYVGFSIFFMSHFGFNTTINGVDCSMKTVDEVAALLEDSASDYEIALSERGDATESIAGSDIAFAYDSQSGLLQESLDAQNSWAFPARLFGTEQSETKALFTYDEALLNAKADELSCVTNPDPIQPKDAYLIFNGTSYEIVPEEEGTAIDVEALKSALAESVSRGETQLVLADAGCYVPPAVTQDSTELAERAELLNEYVPFALTYTMPDGSEVQLNGETIFDWMTLGEDGTYTIDSSKVSEWVAALAEQWDTVGATRTFTSVDGSTYTVSGGSYGWSIDQEAEVESINNMLTTKVSETRDPIWASQAAVYSTDGSPDWGNTYIELNLTTQHVYYVQDGQSVFSTDIISGLPTASRITPDGVYSILEMMRNKTLRGEEDENGVPEYETPVSYWMRMTWTGVGFHDATWQSSFGQGLNYTRGSHGCINMSLSDAATLYGLTYVGCPVVSHY